MRYLLLILCLSAAAVGAAPPPPAASAGGEVVKVVSMGFEDFPGVPPKSQTPVTHWYSPQGQRIELDGVASVIPAGQPYEFTLDARHKIATRWPYTGGVETFSAGSEKRFVDYLGYHCQIFEKQLPGSSGGVDALVTPLAGQSVLLQTKAWQKGELDAFSSAVRVDEHADPPPGGFAVPPGYKVVIGKLPPGYAAIMGALK